MSAFQVWPCIQCILHAEAFACKLKKNLLSLWTPSSCEPVTVAAGESICGEDYRIVGKISWVLYSAQYNKCYVTLLWWAVSRCTQRQNKLKPSQHWSSLSPKLVQPPWLEFNPFPLHVRTKCVSALSSSGPGPKDFNPLLLVGILTWVSVTELDEVDDRSCRNAVSS